jgi:hypothetical protein
VSGDAVPELPALEISAALLADLAILTEALDDPDMDVTETLRRVARDAQIAVASYVGLSVVIELDGRQLTLTAFERFAGPADIQTSLSTPLPLGQRSARSDSPTEAGITLVLYAATPGAFVDLAADLSWLAADTLPGLRGISLDEHRKPELVQNSTLSLSGLTAVNQAIGVLIERGRTPEEAERELFLDAARDGVDLADSAAAVLARIADPPDGVAEV